MTELLYNKSKAVAALNKVEGFNPLELARRISNEGEAEQLYSGCEIPETLVPAFKSDRENYQ